MAYFQLSLHIKLQGKSIFIFNKKSLVSSLACSFRCASEDLNVQQMYSAHFSIIWSSPLFRLISYQSEPPSVLSRKTQLPFSLIQMFSRQPCNAVALNASTSPKTSVYLDQPVTDQCNQAVQYDLNHEIMKNNAFVNNTHQ